MLFTRLSVSGLVLGSISKGSVTMLIINLLAQINNAADLLAALILLALFALIIASLWIIFTKAGQPGWASLIPFYNLYVMLQIVGKPAWWLLLFLIPVFNIIPSILLYFDLARAFGKGTGFALGLIFLPMIFLPILAFSDAAYARHSGNKPNILQNSPKVFGQR
jgi:hypothetical protein